jgi:hypothetical protein
MSPSSKLKRKGKLMNEGTFSEKNKNVRKTYNIYICVCVLVNLLNSIHNKTLHFCLKFHKLIGNEQNKNQTKQLRIALFFSRENHCGTCVVLFVKREPLSLQKSGRTGKCENRGKERREKNGEEEEEGEEIRNNK